MTIRQIGGTAVCSPLRRIALLTVAILFFVSITAFAIPPMMYDVKIYDGEKVVAITTSERDPEKVLENAGITVSEAYGDTVSFANFTGEDGSAIIIRRGVKVTLKNFDGTTHTIYTSGTVGDAIDAAGIKLRKGTALNYEADDLLEEGMEIEIYDIFNVVIKVDGKEIKKTVSGKTVADAINLAGIKLSEDDFTKPDLKAPIEKNLVIEVFRVKVEKRTENEEIPYDTTYTYNKSLYKDQEQVMSKGVKGAKAVVYEDRFVNGELTSSVEVSQKVLKKPVNALVQVGTKNRRKVNPVSTGVQNFSKNLPVGTPMSELKNPSYLTIGANGVPTSYSSVIKAKATAYSAPGGITSTGKRAKNGYIAVDPKEIPYGTEMYIVSADGKYVYGYCIAADTGGFIHSVDWTVDLHMNTEEQCIKWGRRDIIIYVL